MTSEKKCETCDGTGKVGCDECGESGYDNFDQECAYCDGEGSSPCCDCEEVK
jgi:hypothetical protein